MICPAHGTDHAAERAAADADGRLDVLITALKDIQDERDAAVAHIRNIGGVLGGILAEVAAHRQARQRVETLLGDLPDGDRISVGLLRAALNPETDAPATEQPACTCDSAHPMMHTSTCAIIEWMHSR